MSNGRTHDVVTLVGAAALCFIAPWQVTAGFLFGGLMFNGDLDIWSNPTRRWGPLALWWWPYRKIFKHRSFWTHGPIVGTLIRLAWICPLFYWYVPSLEVIIGLEFGAMSHTMMDITSTIRKSINRTLGSVINK